MYWAVVLQHLHLLTLISWSLLWVSTSYGWCDCLPSILYRPHLFERHVHFQQGPQDSAEFQNSNQHNLTILFFQEAKRGGKQIPYQTCYKRFHTAWTFPQATLYGLKPKKNENSSSMQEYVTNKRIHHYKQVQEDDGLYLKPKKVRRIYLHLLVKDISS